MEDCGAGCDRVGVGVQKAALEVAWRGLETRLWGAYLVGGKDQEKAAAEVSRAFPSHMCLPVRGHGLPREPPTEVGTGRPWVLLHYLGLHLPKASKPSGVPRASQPFCCSLNFSLRKIVSQEHSWVKFYQPCMGDEWPRQTCEDAALLRLLLWAVHGPAHTHVHIGAARGHTRVRSVSCQMDVSSHTH